MALRKGTGWGLIVFGLIGLSVEIDDAFAGKSENRSVGLTMAVLSIAGGALLVRSGSKLERERRNNVGRSEGVSPPSALPLSSRVLRVARAHKGRITAAEVSAEAEIEFDLAKEELERLHQGGACGIEIGAEGIRVYRFLEFESEDAKKDVIQP
jgi:hypothetical protein